MPRRALILVLATLELATVLTGCRTVAVAHATTAAPPGRVAAAVAVAPAPQAVAVVAAPVRKPVTRVKPTTRRTSTAPVRGAAVRRTRISPARTTQPGLTMRLLMLAAVARIPGYRPGSVTWVMTTRYGSWGTADWYHATIYISPRVPTGRMYDVVAHEWAHIVSVRPYASVDAAITAMNRTFGGTGLTGAERAADCMARQLGARWTAYTSCSRDSWRRAANHLLAGRPA